MERIWVVRRTDFFGGRWPQGFVPLPAAAGRELLASFERRGFFTGRAGAERQPAWKQLIPYCVVARGAELFCVQRLRRQSEGRLHGLRSIGIGGHVNPVDEAPGGRPGACVTEGHDAGHASFRPAPLGVCLPNRTDSPAFGRTNPGGDSLARTPHPRRRGLLDAALRRELREEIEVRGGHAEPEFLGLLNDDSTDVGRVHAGLVYRLDVTPSTEVKVRENHKMRGCFRPAAELLETALRGAAGAPRNARVVESERLWQDSGPFESWSAIMLERGPWACPGASCEGSNGPVSSREESHNG